MNIAVVGAGISGATVARKLAEAGFFVSVFEKKQVVGGSCYDAEQEAGLYVQKYGAHIFHTSNKNVVDFLSRFTDWRPYKHSVLGLVKGKLIPIPFNFESIDSLFPKEEADEFKKRLSLFGENERISILDLLKCGDKRTEYLACFIFENVFKNYTQKQWGRKCEDVSYSVLSRVPVVTGYCRNYFRDDFEAIPKHGYSTMIFRMLNHPNIKTCFNREITERDLTNFDFSFFSGRIDSFYWKKFDSLEYRSLHFDFANKENKFFQPVAVVNFPGSERYTRIIDFNRLSGGSAEHTTIAYEFPRPFVDGENEPYYPVCSQENLARYERYRELARKEKRIVFFGRLGDYKYYNMDEAVSRAISIAEQFIHENRAANECLSQDR